VFVVLRTSVVTVCNHLSQNDRAESTGPSPRKGSGSFFPFLLVFQISTPQAIEKPMIGSRHHPAGAAVEGLPGTPQNVCSRLAFPAFRLSPLSAGTVPCIPGLPVMARKKIHAIPANPAFDLLKGLGFRHQPKTVFPIVPQPLP